MYDDANPEQKTYTNLTITMKRNENRPRFAQSDYNVDVLEIESPGTVIREFTATDNDGVGNL